MILSDDDSSLQLSYQVISSNIDISPFGVGISGKDSQLHVWTEVIALTLTSNGSMDIDSGIPVTQLDSLSNGVCVIRADTLSIANAEGHSNVTVSGSVGRTVIDEEDVTMVIGALPVALHISGRVVDSWESAALSTLCHYVYKCYNCRSS